MGGCGNSDGQYDKSAGYLDFTPSTSDLSDSSAVVAELATLLTANRLSVTNRAIIENAYTNSLGTGGEAKEKEALQVAKVLMVRASFDILCLQCTLSFFTFAKISSFCCFFSKRSHHTPNRYPLLSFQQQTLLFRTITSVKHLQHLQKMNQHHIKLLFISTWSEVWTV